MKNATIVTTAILASALIVSPLSAAQAQTSREETLGVGAGGLVGAAAGGPMGFIVGAAIGAKIGDSFHRRNERIDTLSADLDASHDTIGDLELDIAALSRGIDAMAEDLAYIEQVSYPELTRLLEAGVSMDLLFRTDEHVLPASTSERFAAFAERLATMPNVQLNLDGFADPRGASDYNQRLSAQRVEQVRGLLIAAGVSPERITTAAHGETEAQDRSPDSLALERRVSVTLSLTGEASLAANPR